MAGKRGKDSKRIISRMYDGKEITVAKFIGLGGKGYMSAVFVDTNEIVLRDGVPIRWSSVRK